MTKRKKSTFWAIELFKHATVKAWDILNTVGVRNHVLNYGYSIGKSSLKLAMWYIAEYWKVFEKRILINKSKWLSI